jgi:hypothetical protein
MSIFIKLCKILELYVLKLNYLLEYSYFHYKHILFCVLSKLKNNILKYN